VIQNLNKCLILHPELVNEKIITITMKKIKFYLTLSVLLTTLVNYSQQKGISTKVKVTGKIVEKVTNLPLEFSTISLVNISTNKVTSGGITDANGNFNFDTNPGVFNIKVEFISFKSIEIKSKTITSDTNLGSISLQPDAAQLKEVVIASEKASVEIKLDKKVYNVGQDVTAKGGTASDVLDNVPSVNVDGDGNVSLRGNENVKIFIDGRPSNSINIADALKSISADALDKVEVITNPSARYDAEGGAGIINIVLKKGKNKGINGTLVANAGDPKNYGTNATLNFKSENFNFFTSLGYQDIQSRGKTINNTNYLDNSGAILKTIDEIVTRQNGRKGFNYGFGMDVYVNKKTTWTNSFSYRKSDGFSPNNDDLSSYQINNNFVQNRYTDQMTKTQDIEYNSILSNKFKKEGHELNLIFTTTKNIDNDYATIINSYFGGAVVGITSAEKNLNLQNQFKNLLQADYVLPFGNGNKNRLEAGYKGDFNKIFIDYSVGSLDSNNNFLPYANYTNKFDYKERINALYTQFGTNIDKFSFLVGIRYEDSNIDINLLTTNNFRTKKYHNFFPSAFLNYALTEKTTLSLNYSKRISRPRYRFLTPFSNYTSNINLFVGNSDINPSLTDAIELALLNKIGKASITSSIYYNKTYAPFQFIRRPNGSYANSIVNGQSVSTPVIIWTPVNLDTDTRYGFEFNINYNPTKWIRLNGNFNIFTSRVLGNYSYSIPNQANPSVLDYFYNNVDISANSWFAKLSSKFTLPKKIDLQFNGTYNAPQNTAQGKSIGIAAANIGLSKDILKDKGTIALNVNDIFNSRKRISETYLPTISSYNEMQMRVRQITLSFTYRFNKQKSEKEKSPRKEGEGDNGDFGG